MISKGSKVRVIEMAKCENRYVPSKKIYYNIVSINFNFTNPNFE